MPGGKFTIGSPATEEDREGDEGQVEVEVTGFWMAKYETTQEEWEAVMGENPSEYKGGKLPVEGVDWEGGVAYAKKVDVRLEDENKREGWQVRLPTEAEWDYACRGGTTPPFYWGASAGSDKANLNGAYPYGGAAKGVLGGDDGGGKLRASGTAPVGALRHARERVRVVT